ncbi:hypothetical protein F3Y22_tig00013565pilonHSYRG00040 [Hibiscus syriacus]|uniref:Protein kinase domain-containing protein n=1 Tax=Hibiscus syriacus TaxID=106335 RepID=A0A6A3C1D7_HIBSY|nr:hypothetical protein F3Y22_tig00013565pilonHSYRG00040 [Hibiscus syriacus]
MPDGIGNLINLEILAASVNQLSGPIPFYIGRLQKLKLFRAQANFLSGTIPESIANLTMLTKFGLDSNNLQGSIPASLDLSSNYLTGELPVEVGKLKNLGDFLVSQNSLSSLLPNDLGSCASLEKLFLYGNYFEGPIPSCFTSLRGLVALDVSDNNLSGGVQEFLMSFVALKYLILSFNDFDGVISTERIIRNATDVFFAQNFLGSGSFGFVSNGILEESGATIAVKVLNHPNRGASRSFLIECETLKNIRHRNLVKVLIAISSVDYKGNDFKALVYEFMAYGSLEHWLHPSNDVINESHTMRNHKLLP